MPTIHWSKLRSPLPWQHQLQGDTLIIPRVAQQDSGQYICNATSPAGHAEATIALHVESPPYATTVPEHTSVRAGETVQLQCLAHGTPPLTFQWSRVGGSLPARATARNELLRFESVAPEDSGRYRCQVTNKVGSAEAFAQVFVQGPSGSVLATAIPAGSTPTVQVTPQLETKSIGASVEFHCAVPSDRGTQLRWIKEGVSCLLATVCRMGCSESRTWTRVAKGHIFARPMDRGDRPRPVPNWLSKPCPRCSSTSGPPCRPWWSAMPWSSSAWPWVTPSLK